MKKYQIFLYENFQFLEVKFSIYLNRRVFVMYCSHHPLSGAPGGLCFLVVASPGYLPLYFWNSLRISSQLRIFTVRLLFV